MESNFWQIRAEKGKRKRVKEKGGEEEARDDYMHYGWVRSLSVRVHVHDNKARPFIIGWGWMSRPLYSNERASRCCVEAKIMATISRASSISPQTSDENVSIFPAHKRKKSFFGLCRPHFRPFRLLARMRGTFYPYILVRVSGNWPCWRCFFLFSVCLFRLFRTIFVNPLSFSRPMPK